MEILLSWTLHQRRPLMRQVNQFLDVEARGMVVGQWSEIGELGFAHDVLCTWFVEEHVVHDAAPPDHHPVLSAETLVADEGVAAAVVVVCVVVGS